MRTDGDFTQRRPGAAGGGVDRGCSLSADGKFRLFELSSIIFTAYWPCGVSGLGCANLGTTALGRCWPTLFALQILWTLPAKICQDTDQAKPRRVALAPHTWATSIYSDFEYCGEGRSCKVRFFDGGGGVSAYASA